MTSHDPRMAAEEAAARRKGERRSAERRAAREQEEREEQEAREAAAKATLDTAKAALDVAHAALEVALEEARERNEEALKLEHWEEWAEREAQWLERKAILNAQLLKQSVEASGSGRMLQSEEEELAALAGKRQRELRVRAARTAANEAHEAAAEVKRAWRVRRATWGESRKFYKELMAEKAARARAKQEADFAAANRPQELLSATEEIPALPLPMCEQQAATFVEVVIKNTTGAMSDLLLYKKTRTPRAPPSLKLMYQAVKLCPHHAKAWYRFGFLLRRTTGLLAAAALALDQATLLGPMTSGPAHAELTLLRLDELMARPGPMHLYKPLQHTPSNPELCAIPRDQRTGGTLVLRRATDHTDVSTDVYTGELAVEVNRTFTEARSLNARLMRHTIQSVFTKRAGSLFDIELTDEQLAAPPAALMDRVMSTALEERRLRRETREAKHASARKTQMKREADRCQSDASCRPPIWEGGVLIHPKIVELSAVAEMSSCIATRAQVDVLRLRQRPGDEEAAAELERAMLTNLEGREMPPQVYVDPAWMEPGSLASTLGAPD